MNMVSICVYDAAGLLTPLSPEEDNAYDSVDIWASMHPSAPHFSAKQAALEAVGLGYSTSTPFSLDRAGIPPELLISLRIQYAEGAYELSRLSLAVDGPLSEDNEVRVRNALKNALQGMLAGYVTSVEEDEASLRALGVRFWGYTLGNDISNLELRGQSVYHDGGDELPHPPVPSLSSTAVAAADNFTFSTTPPTPPVMDPSDDLSSAMSTAIGEGTNTNTNTNIDANNDAEVDIKDALLVRVREIISLSRSSPHPQTHIQGEPVERDSSAPNTTNTPTSTRPSPISWRERNAIILRHSEKRILLQALSSL